MNANGFFFVNNFKEIFNNSVKERDMHPQFDDPPRSINARANPLETEIEYWRSQAQDYLRAKVQTENSLNTNRAKNIIMFLGDGMSLPTVAATRMYMGGEEEQLSFEKFPHFGLSKVCTRPSINNALKSLPLQQNLLPTAFCMFPTFEMDSKLKKTFIYRHTASIVK